jgi:hypothetical protein
VTLDYIHFYCTYCAHYHLAGPLRTVCSQRRRCFSSTYVSKQNVIGKPLLPLSVIIDRSDAAKGRKDAAVVHTPPQYRRCCAVLNAADTWPKRCASLSREMVLDWKPNKHAGSALVTRDTFE